MQLINKMHKMLLGYELLHKIFYGKSFVMKLITLLNDGTTINKEKLL